MPDTIHRLIAQLFQRQDAAAVPDAPRHGIPDECLAKLPPPEERYDTYETVVHHVERAEPARQPR